MTAIVYWLDLAGVAVFALSGVILAYRSRMDPFGMLVLASATGIGGGTLRDLVLGVRPVFWITDSSYLWVVLATTVVASAGFRHLHRITRTVLPVVDAFGLSLFTAVGTHKALLLDTPGSVAVVMGLFTGVAGGMIRDILVNRIPMVLREQIYATASIAGGITLVALHALDTPFPVAITATIAVTLGLRLVAIRWKLSLPVFAWIVGGSDRGSDDDEGRFPADQ